MAKFAVQSAADPLSDGSLAPIAGRRELFEMLAPFNVAPERDDPAEAILYGPGIRIELDDRDPVTQFQLIEVDTDISHRVLVRIARSFDWVLTDLETGTPRHLYRPPAEDDA